MREATCSAFYVYVLDTDEVYRRALTAGAGSIEARFDTPYGDRRAVVRDPAGNTWQIATRRASRAEPYGTIRYDRGVTENLPPRLKEVVEDFAFVDRSERAELLIDYADKFEAVPERIATRPFPEENHVQRCESDAYVWAEDQPDGTLKFHFAVENPQGLSAKSWAVILDETLSGQPLEQVAKVPPEVVFSIYGKDLSMGKGQGLMGMLDHVTSAARRRLSRRE